MQDAATLGKRENKICQWLSLFTCSKLPSASGPTITPDAVDAFKEYSAFSVSQTGILWLQELAKHLIASRQQCSCAFGLRSLFPKSGWRHLYQQLHGIFRAYKL